jgi:hypothetical protein
MNRRDIIEIQNMIDEQFGERVEYRDNYAIFTYNLPIVEDMCFYLEVTNLSLEPVLITSKDSTHTISVAPNDGLVLKLKRSRDVEIQTRGIKDEYFAKLRVEDESK